MIKKIIIKIKQRLCKHPVLRRVRINGLIGGYDVFVCTKCGEHLV